MKAKKQVSLKEMRDSLVVSELNKLKGPHGNHLRTLLYKGHTGWNNMPKRIVREQYEELLAKGGKNGSVSEQVEKQING
ncbi:MAG: hypothetical protein H8E05_00125 [Bacteroidetes bacterium]|nr:hypothetical protein [Bacteroidota bacterium]